MVHHYGDAPVRESSMRRLGASSEPTAADLPTVTRPSLGQLPTWEWSLSPCLLAGMNSNSEHGGNLVGVRAFLINEAGDVNDFDKKPKRIVDLVKDLWPDIDTLRETRMQAAIRSMNDYTKHDFFIRPEDGYILIRSDIARMLVESDRVLMLEETSEVFDSFIQELSHVLRSHPGGTMGSPFELRVIECVVCAAATMHHWRLQVMKHAAQDIFSKISLEKCDDSILQLYPLSMAVQDFIDMMGPLTLSLQQLLREEGEQLYEMLEACRSSVLSFCLAPPLGHGIEEALENWGDQVDEIMADAKELCSDIENTTRFLQASMSCTQNRLIRWTTFAEIAALALAIGTVVAAIWGMNVKNTLENVNLLFHISNVVSLVLGIILVISAICYVRRGSQRIAKDGARFGCNKFYNSVGDDMYILELSNSLSDGSFDDADGGLKRVMQDLREPALPEPRATLVSSHSPAGSLEADGRLRRRTSERGPSQVSLLEAS